MEQFEEFLWIKCDGILLKVKDGVCHDPDVDLAPYAQTLADEFEKRNRAWEKRFIGTLFLKLYEWDAQSLRRDLCRLDPWSVLCKLEALDAAKDKFPQRIPLLNHYLYRELSFNSSFYLRKDAFSFIEELCSSSAERGGAAKQKRLENILEILSKFKEEVCCNPDAEFVPSDTMPYILTLTEECNRAEAAYVEDFFQTLFLTLYGSDVQSLKRDITKVAMLGANAGRPRHTDRADLLQCLYGALSSHIGEDFSDIMEMCDKAEGFRNRTASRQGTP